MMTGQKTASPDAPIILALEASGEHASAAIVQDGILLAETRMDQRHGHASHFVSLAHESVQAAALRFADITHVAAGIGPGSFTGLRVCLSAAKGFVLAGSLVGVGVNGLRARAFAAQQTGVALPVIACADTRRGVFFCQSYDEALIAQDEIKEASLEALAALAQGRSVALPPLEEDQEAGVAEMIVTQMSARHIGLLAAQDIAKADGPLLPLDALYVAAPKLGPPKKAS